MRKQSDISGIINALTHLNVISPSVERRDTLAYVYANNSQHLQALNTIGIEKNDTDSDLAVQVKAISLKALNQPKRALEQFEVLYSRQPNAYNPTPIWHMNWQISRFRQEITPVPISTLNMVFLTPKMI
jgi:hypothetical protein